MIKRFKNRLKGLDECVRKISVEKAESSDLMKLEKIMAKGRAEAVFTDMRELLDCTMKSFESKVTLER